MKWIKLLVTLSKKLKALKPNSKFEILIVEDDLIVSRLHKFSLKGALDSEVNIVDNGKEALEYLDDVAVEKQKILVLLDLNMPVMNGWDFLEACHSRPYIDRLVVVVVTSSLYSDDNKRALKYPRVMGFYTKPLRREHIPQILEHPEVAPHLS